MTRASYLAPITSYRLRGDSFLRLARALAIPAQVGRPRRDTVRFARPNDAERTRTSALRSAAYWYGCAARLVLTKGERP